MPPLLIEPGTKYFLSETLKKCNEKRLFQKHILVNVSLFLFFVSTLAFYLHFKYKNKPTKEELNKKNREKSEYILSKVANVFYENHVEQEKMITNLPKFESDYELLHNKFYS